ncbi:MAG: hypothetical protein F9K22_05110 [Bacteroidetes bacterium]|nr:MAG: hypothetical protein F9K22_05110 [Bacteroidota bacterium]
MNNTLIMFAIAAAFTAFSCAPSKETAAEVPGAAPAPITASFTMLTVNLGHGLKDKTDVRAFAEWVKKSGAEVVAVQQIERATDSKPGFDAYMELLKRLDMRGTFAKARYYQGWDSGNALFCLYPMLQSNVFPIPTGKGKVRRAMSFAVFELGLKSVAFASVDLDEEDLGERAKQVYEIIAVQRTMEEQPMVLAGQFGEPAGGKATARLSGRYTAANPLAENLRGVRQHLYVPTGARMEVTAVQRLDYAPLQQTALLATITVRQ